MLKKERPLLLNVLLKKCPKCQRDDLFKQPLQLSKPLLMNDRCGVCQQKFEPEPGFYYGAMFISYILSSFFFLATAAVLIIFAKLTVNQTFAIIILLAILGYIWLLRISRSIWIHTVVQFDPNLEL